MFSRIVVVLSNLPEFHALPTAIDLDQFVRVLDIQGGTIFAISGDGANQLSTATGLRRAMSCGTSDESSWVGGQRSCAVLDDVCVSCKSKPVHAGRRVH